jgi:hypothetical protein
MERELVEIGFFYGLSLVSCFAFGALVGWGFAHLQHRQRDSERADSKSDG